jgi:hypothetical protein
VLPDIQEEAAEKISQALTSIEDKNHSKVSILAVYDNDQASGKAEIR